MVKIVFPGSDDFIQLSNISRNVTTNRFRTEVSRIAKNIPGSTRTQIQCRLLLYLFTSKCSNNFYAFGYKSTLLNFHFSIKSFGVKVTVEVNTEGKFLRKFWSIKGMYKILLLKVHLQFI